MADQTHIEWTDATWNIITGCSVVSPGCTNCYAMKLAGTRLRDHPSRAGLTINTKSGPVWNGQVRFNTGWLDQPLRWAKPRRIFVCAHADLFHDGVDDAWLDKIFAVMALSPQHTFQILTKRPERMQAYVRSFYEREGVGGQPLPNVWLGVSIEDQVRANERIPILLDTPAAVRWISAEPLLGPIDLQEVEIEAPRRTFRNFLDGRGLKRGDTGPFQLTQLQTHLDWVVVGGESGPSARPMHPDWVRWLRDQCATDGVPFLFKQWGEWAPGENAQNTLGRAVETADWFNESWDFQRLTASDCEGMHIDDEPTLYHAGKKAAGRRLDGVQHDGYPVCKDAV